jgi:hypothetical protein
MENFSLYKVGRHTLALRIVPARMSYVVTHEGTGRTVVIAESEVRNVGLHDRNRVRQRVAELAAAKLGLV